MKEKSVKRRTVVYLYFEFVCIDQNISKRKKKNLEVIRFLLDDKDE